jgi:hypothetical protein
VLSAIHPRSPGAKPHGGSCWCAPSKRSPGPVPSAAGSFVPAHGLPTSLPLIVGGKEAEAHRRCRRRR